MNNSTHSFPSDSGFTITSDIKIFVMNGMPGLVGVIVGVGGTGLFSDTEVIDKGMAVGVGERILSLIRIFTALLLASVEL